MSLRANGSYIGPRPDGPSTTVASGIWDLRTAERQQRKSEWPVQGDLYFSSVALLLHCDGFAASFADSSQSPKTITAAGSATQSATQSKWGGKSAALLGNGAYLRISNMPNIGTGDFVLEAWVFIAGSQSDNSALFDFRYPGVTGFNVEIDQSRRLSVNLPYNSRAHVSTLPLSQWVHVAVARSSGTTRTFVGGSLVDSTADGNNYNLASLPYGFIGANFDVSSYGWSSPNYYVDDVRLTVGSGRGYAGATIPVPTAAFPDSGPPPTPINVQYLVVAGGGGGGGGGGGAGGYRSSVVGELSGGGASAESLFAATPGTTYTVTVGGGGAGGVYATAKGVNGSNSAFATITSAGGGGGGSAAGNSSTVIGANGGSGGGGGAFLAGSNFSGGAATSSQGYAGATGRPTSNVGAGGGGGAGGIGADGFGGDESGGNGGPGRASSITGTSVSRGGGGGGGPGGGGSGGTATAGGGNASSSASSNPSAATQNTGGGGGGGGGGYTGGGASGGSGVVIIRSPVAAASTTGSPTVTTVSGDTVYTFTGSGSITF